MGRHFVLASSLNLRMAPDTGSGSLGTVPRWTLLEETGANIDRSWLKTIVSGQDAWVSNGYLLPENLVNDHQWMKRAALEFGVGEYADDQNPSNNPRIVDYHRSYGVTGSDSRDAVAWCSSFVNWCLKPSYNTEDTDQSARSWRDWGQASEGFRPGSIMVFWRRPDADENEEQHGWSKQRLIEEGGNGHVSFLVEIRDGQAIVLGGNQSSNANRLGEVNKKAYPLDSDNYGLLKSRWPA